MGQLNEVLRAFNGDAFAEAREQAATLFELGATRAALMELELNQHLNALLAGGDDKQTIPVSNILDAHSEVHALTAYTDPGHIIDTFKNALANFVPGGRAAVIDSISILLSGVLKASLQDPNTHTEGKALYVVLADGPSLVRLDIKMWYSDVSSRALHRAAEKIVVVSAVKSTIDVTRLALNTFLSVYQRQLMSSSGSRVELTREIEDIAALFRALKRAHEA
ncbi:MULTISPECIES: hypothetical protein [unclassified Pseudomonas]|uniref:hypothetical protein n=1 Tax=unclassified Pseudomonas TaxID=196821 RepID=UPI0021C8E5D5|nr:MULTISPECIES: hypothetical protein [unclassified Pseudomonas]MCU1730754.1 hypothetical protein [Pseudomonas sp. 20P_3.2_Bac4]MCU1742892.1 hypothetical protein [Pseudomonas sp. 20P_3.2_Bac5]